MAIVEDEVRNDSEEENDIEVVVEEYDAEQDSDDSDDDDDAVAEALESKVEELEQRIKDDPYNYDDHIELIQALWGLTDLDKWRAAFDRLQQMTALKPEHWLMRLQTESTLSHSAENRKEIANLFQQATLDCYSIQILSEWCSWTLSTSLSEDGDVKYTRSQIEEVLVRAGSDPLSGKIFWDAKLEFEKAQADNMTQEDPKYSEQKERILFCLEEMVSRPLLRAEQAWEPLLELGQMIHGKEYVDKVTKQHEAAMEYLQKITPFEDKLLTLEDIEEKYRVYEDYIEMVKELSKEDKFKNCESDSILKVLYDRASTECLAFPETVHLLRWWACFVRACSSRATYWRVLNACVRRAPRTYMFYTMQMQQLEHEGKDSGEMTVKSIFEAALAKGMNTYKSSESLWMSYIEYSRRKTDFTDMKQVDLLRSTCRLAWDSLAEAWGESANDCEVPLYWARLEYQRIKDPKAGREIFEESFRYGEGKTFFRHWETLLRCEMTRTPPISEHKLRELFKRALRSVKDYPPAVAIMWMDYERDFGQLETLRDCIDATEMRVKEWRNRFNEIRDKMMFGHKTKCNKTDKYKQKQKCDKKKTEDKPSFKGKRKSEEAGESGKGKRKKNESMDVVVEKEEDRNSKGVKRSHDNGSDEEKDTKRLRRDSSEDSRPGGAREACTLFVSNLVFKVDEQNLRDKLSHFGDIVSLRVRSGVKAFGGSICYCQYKNKEAVDEALKHDRALLEGRPMFLSRYSAKKSKPQFKYDTALEKNKLFVRNLPYDNCTKEELAKIFDKYGTVKDIRVVTFKDGKPKGLAYIDYEDDESAAKAIDGTNGMLLGERNITVALSAPPPRAETSRAETTLGQVKPDTGGMRRTQLSSFIPSSVVQKTPFLPRVLQKPAQAGPSTSKASNGDQTQPSDDQTEKRPMSNKDFRSMLLGDKK